MNDLPQLSIQPRSLHHAHLPSLVSGIASISIGAGGGFHHKNEFIGFTDTTYASSKHTGSGWYVVTDDTSDVLEVAHTPIEMVDSAGEVQSKVYIAMANIQVNKIDSELAILVYDRGVRIDYYAVFQFQLQLRSGTGTPTWRNVAFSQRFVSAETNNGYHGASSGGTDGGKANIACMKDVPLRMMIHGAQIKGWGYDNIHGVRVVCSVWDDGRGNNDVRAYIHHSNLSAFTLGAPKTNV